MSAGSPMSDLSDTPQSEGACPLPKRVEFAQWLLRFVDPDRSSDYREAFWDLLRALLTQYQGDGKDGIEPFVTLSKAQNKGLFALVRTSNPGGDAVQSLQLADGRSVAEAVAQVVASLGASSNVSTISSASVTGRGFGTPGMFTSVFPDALATATFCLSSATASGLTGIETMSFSPSGTQEMMLTKFSGNQPSVSCFLAM